jgi:flagellar basal-body rod protein FlgG
MVNMIELRRHFEMQVKAIPQRRRERRRGANSCASANQEDICMNPALWAAKTGLDAQQTKLAVTSNNLANVSTAGFKKGRAVFEDLLYQNIRQVGGSTSQDTRRPSGVHLGTGVRVVATEKLYTQGRLHADRQCARRRPSKAAASFQIQMPDGTTAYTR